MIKSNHVENNEALTVFYDLGRIITDFRRRKGFTQKDFAEKCEITASYLSQIEKGHKMPSYALIAKICEQLGISQNDLFRLIFIDSFLEAKDESKTEVIAILRELLDKLIIDEKRIKDMTKQAHQQSLVDMA